MGRGVEGEGSARVWREQASAPTPTGVTNSPNRVFGVWKNGGNGGKWSAPSLPRVAGLVLLPVRGHGAGAGAHAPAVLGPRAVPVRREVLCVSRAPSGRGLRAGVPVAYDVRVSPAGGRALVLSAHRAPCPGMHSKGRGPTGGPGGGWTGGWRRLPSGCGRLPSVTNAIQAGTWRQGDSGWA